MKKIITILVVLFIVCCSIVFISCDKNVETTKQQPVYQGMKINKVNSNSLYSVELKNNN